MNRMSPEAELREGSLCSSGRRPARNCKPRAVIVKLFNNKCWLISRWISFVRIFCLGGGHGEFEQLAAA